MQTDCLSEFLNEKIKLDITRARKEDLEELQSIIGNIEFTRNRGLIKDVPIDWLLFKNLCKHKVYIICRHTPSGLKLIYADDVFTEAKPMHFKLFINECNKLKQSL